MKYISYSQYSTFKSCKTKHYFHYIEKLRLDEGNIAFAFGTAFHEALQEYIKSYYGKSNTITTSNTIDLFNEIFLSEISKDKQLTKNTTENEFMDLVNKAKNMIKDGIKNWKKNYPKSKFELVGIEVELKKNLFEDLFFIGFIDVLLKNKKNKNIIIIDIKTANKGWNQQKIKQSRAQLLLYKHFYPANNIETHYFVVKKQFTKADKKYNNTKLSRKIVVPSKRTIKKVKNNFYDFVNEVYVKEYNKNNIVSNPSYLCNWCIYGGSTLCQNYRD